MFALVPNTFWFGFSTFLKMFLKPDIKKDAIFQIRNKVFWDTLIIYFNAAVLIGYLSLCLE
jgi:hypothetical protein